MKLIILLISIVLQTFNISLFRNRYQLFDHYVSFIKPTLDKMRLYRGWGAIIGIIFPLVFVVFILQVIFSHLGILYFLYGLLVLLLCLDVRDIKSKLADYFTAMNTENRTRAQVEVEKFANQPVDEDKSIIIRILTGAIFVQSMTNIFSVIFWFFLLGPTGAILYYLVAAMSERVTRYETNTDESYAVASYLKEILDWIPVRLVSFTYALVGHFAPVFSLWLKELPSGVANNSNLLIDSGLLALDIPKEPESADVDENLKAIGLVNRTLWTWLIIIVVLSIASWLF